MSFLNTHLFGKRRTGPYMSPVAARVARCAQAHALSNLRVTILAVMLGLAIPATESYFAFNVFTFRIARIPPPASKPLVVQAFDAFKKSNPPTCSSGHGSFSS